jgi:hypothetical protein
MSDMTHSAVHDIDVDSKVCLCFVNQWHDIKVVQATAVLALKNSLLVQVDRAGVSAKRNLHAFSTESMD